MTLSARVTLGFKVQRSKVCLARNIFLSFFLFWCLFLERKYEHEEQFKNYLYFKFLEPVVLYPPTDAFFFFFFSWSCFSFTVVADLNLGRSKKTTHAGAAYVLSIFFDKQWKEREINLSASNLFLPTSAVGFGRPVLFAVAPGTVI